MAQNKNAKKKKLSPKEKEKKQERKEKKKRELSDLSVYRMKKVLKITAIICALILLVEAIVYIVLWYQREQATSYYEATSMVDIDGNYRIAVGSSDFRYSSKVGFTDGVEKGRLVKYDKNGNIVWEKAYDSGIRSTFSAVKTLNDGYLVAGSAEFTDYQHENNIREGLIIKYDFDGNKFWERRYSVLSDTRYLDLLIEDDGFVAIGQSIYENMELGNHSTGGGIIVKYDFDGNLVWNANYGGNKSGIFSGIAKMGEDYVVVGRDSKDTGITVVFDKEGNRKAVRNYSYTDSQGFQDVVVDGNSIYVVGSKKIWVDTGDEETDIRREATNTDAIVVKYEWTDQLNLIYEKTFGGSSFERYESVYLQDGYLYAVGHLTSKDTDLTLISEEDGVMTGLIAKIDLEGNVIDKKTYGGSHDDNILYLTLEGDNFVAVGLTKSNDGDLSKKGYSGKDYYGMMFTFDKDLNIK